jgi:hypothetical protein
MTDLPDDDVDAGHAPRLEVWLAERELLSAAAKLRDVLVEETAPADATEVRISYQAAWLRFMVALCNLPLAERPLAVNRVIDALRIAHLLRQPGSLEVPYRSWPPLVMPDIPTHDATPHDGDPFPRPRSAD